MLALPPCGSIRLLVTLHLAPTPPAGGTAAAAGRDRGLRVEVAVLGGGDG